MKAAILRNGAMVVEELPDLSPGPGQVLIEPLACGICGSDLHTVDHAHDLIDAARAAGGGLGAWLDPELDLVMGHEVAGRVVGLGDGVTGVAEGAVFAVMPRLLLPDRMAIPGYDNVYPGGYSSQMLVSPDALVAVPNGLDPLIAALTEPMAVGLHAVNESSISQGVSPLVIGAGPVGLAIIAALAAKGIGPIFAADLSPTRRRVAASMGADIVVDPTEQPLVDRWREELPDAPPPVIYEAVGVPGMIDRVMADAPAHSEILVAGLCLPPDNFRPAMGILKHLSLKFVLGWSEEEFSDSLDNLAEGRIDGRTLVTGEVGIDGVPQAFADLGDPEQHVKILVRPDL